MEKAYSLKDLGESVLAKGKGMGLTMAEDMAEALAEAVYFAVKDWAVQSAAMSENKIDDMVAAFYGQLDAFVLPQIKKIDLNADGK